MSEPEAARPALRVVRGEPTPEELAVVIALASAGGGGEVEPTVAVRGRWNDAALLHRRSVLSGPGGWRASAWL